jgi:hypothetical protein
MFEVIISTVKTGRVERKGFDSRSEADAFVARWEDRILNAKRRDGTPLNRSLADYRVEVRYRELPAVRPVPRPAPAAAA